MFRIRFFTPQVIDESGWPHAGGELHLDAQRLHFRVDLRYWSIADYEAQWREGLARLAHARRPAALMIAYRGNTSQPHVMWALWPEGDHLYVQELSVLPGELDAPFDPRQAHVHVGERIPASELGLPIAEYRVDLVPLLAAYFLPTFRWSSFRA